MLNNWRRISQAYGFYSLLVIHFFGVLVISFADLDFFAGFTPLNLLLSGLLILGAVKESEFKKVLLFALFSFSIGYGVEVLGTQTGFPFGEYWYLHNLGPKLIAVPLMIGVNWFVLAYSSALWAARWTAQPILRAFIASGLMVGLDFFIEPLSAILGFWAWEGNSIPPQNYLAWFVVALLIQAGFIRMKIAEDNVLARWYLPLITAFFILLNILL